ncbi:MAG: glycoside hydrolase family 3 N-terminal domain-containing protein [Robiginitomaculum sp.]
MTLKLKRLSTVAAVLAGLTLITACGDKTPKAAAIDEAALMAAEPDAIHPQMWAKGASGVKRDAAIETRIIDLLSKMTTEQKVGQTVQADIGSVSPADVAKYRLGSILNGGSSGPYGDDRAAPDMWIKLADEFYEASMSEGVSTPIPIMWGIDAVHGHSNVVGATIFPHNIGLGAANDVDLIERIGAATAKEVAVTGIDWTFAPTLAVARDDRWGRGYESYSEDPEIVARYGGAMVTGLQGKAGTDDFLSGERVLATAKHFVGDGGTFGGKDQGDALINEAGLRDIHAAGYRTAIDAGAQTVMASFSSWHGQKMHGNRALLQDVLFDRLGFDGLVVGDWNAQGKLDGCTNDNCPAAFNAGVDIYMAPDSWRGIYDTTLAAVNAGEISMQRLDEGVARILRVKLQAGLLDKGKPSSRPLAGHAEILGSDAHRAIAREAVRKSLVLLKNNGGVLPIANDANILVVGAGANSISQQTGGWTISWQGTDTTHADFPKAQTLLEGFKAAGSHVTYSEDGTYKAKPDVAIVVYGEKPYAEFKGDLKDVDFKAEDESHLAQLRAFKAAGIPTVSVFLTGRPLWVNPELNASDAFVAAWLPGTEAGGVADVMMANAADGKTYDFGGKLSFSWPKRSDQAVLNVGDADYDPLFAYGFGLDKSDTSSLGKLGEKLSIAGTQVGNKVFVKGRPVFPWALNAQNMQMANFDRFAQEDAIMLGWKDNGELAFAGASSDMSFLAQPDAGYVLSVRLDAAPSVPVLLSAEGDNGVLGRVDISDKLRGLTIGEWGTISIPLKCISSDPMKWTAVSAPIVIKSGAGLKLGISEIVIKGLPEPEQVCSK